MNVEDWNLGFLRVVKIVRHQKVVSDHQSFYLHLGPVGSLANPCATGKLNHWNSQLI